ncbi:MAG: hypothetical protein J6Z11_03635 [Candidatus Riflebacteria bacterium]|nr:hypothetical protein [Candidatus Riflebacteria bacterium]
MKNSLGSFSKLLLVSLFAGSMILVGCGESNPTSSSSETANETTTSATAVDTSNSFLVWGGISCDGNEIQNDISITLTNKGTGEVTSKSEKTSYTFDKVVPGVYELKAEGAGYDTFVTCNEFSSQQKIDIALQRTVTNQTAAVPKINFQGSLVDQIGKAVPFATIKAEKVGADTILASTEFNADKYCLLGLSSGTYDVTITKDSFVEKKLTLKITDDYISFNGARIEKENFSNTVDFNDAAGNSHKGYKLAPVIMAPNVLQTGAIAGVLSKNAVIAAEGTIVDLYRRKEDDIHSELGYVMSLKAGANGYFYAKNLSEGYYTVVNQGANVHTESDGTSFIYYFDAGTVYFANAQVISNYMTPVPSDEQ